MKISDELMDEIVKRVMDYVNKQAFSKAQAEKKCFHMPPTEGQSQLMQSFRDKMKTQYISVTEPSQADILCIGSASARALAEVSQGYGETRVSELMLEHLAQGKEVWLLEEGLVYRKYEATCAPKLYEKWMGYEKAVCEMGVKVLSVELFLKEGHNLMAGVACSKKIENTLVTSEVSQVKDPNLESIYLEAKVITERMLMQIKQPSQKALLIQSSAKVTPLAQDYIRQEGLNLQRLEEAKRA